MVQDPEEALPPYFGISPDEALAELGAPVGTPDLAAIADACTRGRDDLLGRGHAADGRKSLRLFSTWEITRYTSEHRIPDDAMPLMGTMFETPVFAPPGPTAPAMFGFTPGAAFRVRWQQRQRSWRRRKSGRSTAVQSSGSARPPAG